MTLVNSYSIRLSFPECGILTFAAMHDTTIGWMTPYNATYPGVFALLDSEGCPMIKGTPDLPKQA